MISRSSSGKGGQPTRSGHDVTADLLGRLAERSAQRRLEVTESVSPQRWSYREAAAVLHCFDPARLRPREPQLAVENLRSLLAGDTQPAAGGRELGYLALKPEPRREALHRLGNAARMRSALAANPDRPGTDVQRMLEAFLHGVAPELEAQSSEQLSLTLQVVTWLGGILVDLPAEAAVREHLARRAPLRRFEYLVREDFVGREKELARLRDYVGVLAPSSLRSAVDRQVRAWLTLERRPPLLLYGPGGVGKSALVGRFLFEHSLAARELRFPFAYLPFDDPLLVVSEPYTLLVEAAHQLAQQYPERGEVHDRFRAVMERFAQGRGDLGGFAAGASSRGAKLEAVGDLDEELVIAFGSLLRRLAAEHQPALFVLDTFEEVQYRPQPELRGLGRMVTTLQRSFPLLRVVASGRAPARELEMHTEDLELGDLDASSAARLLTLQGVSDPQLAASLVRQLGGNPLTLRLAAKAINSHPELVGAGGLSGLSTRRYWIFSIPQALIQGQLYRRVLDHIHDEKVRKLAHPGMVLRRVTPALIRDVLSEPCGVEVPDDATANQLFQALQREHALIRLEDVETLQYRSEVRQPMLRLLERDVPAKVRDIHQRAFRFWESRNEGAARGEELYHRLALDQEPWELEGRWLPELGPSLAASREELPLRAAAWLASHLGLAVDPEVKKAASQADWERSTGHEVVNSLRYQDVKRALELLAGRQDRLPGSALYSLEARAHLLIADADAGKTVLERGLASMPLDANPGRQAEMLWLYAQAAATLGELDLADSSLAQAEIVAHEIRDVLCRVQIVTQRLILSGRAANSSKSNIAALRARLAQALAQLDSEQMDRERTLVRVAAAELQPEHWPVLRQILGAVGAGSVTAAAEDALRAPLETLANQKATPADSADAAQNILAALRAQGFTLDAANLAGIEQYRERWETDSASEAFA